MVPQTYDIVVPAGGWSRRRRAVARVHTGGMTMTWKSIVAANPDHSRSYAQRWDDMVADGVHIMPLGLDRAIGRILGEG